MPEEPRRALVLWDIDHTLVSISGVSREIYEQAFEFVFEQPLRGLADMTGRTERAIVVETLTLNGVAPTEERIECMYSALGGAAKRLEGRMRQAGQRLPGAWEAVRLLMRPAVVQSVVTGNIRVIAEAKLDAVGLSEGIDFDIGGYGDHGTDRADLVRRARELSSQKYGGGIPADRTVVIGDTPHDVRGAHDATVRALGVASGGSSVEDLAAAGADRVLPDLADSRAFETAVFEILGDE